MLSRTGCYFAYTGDVGSSDWLCKSRILYEIEPGTGTVEVHMTSQKKVDGICRLMHLGSKHCGSEASSTAMR